MDWTLLTDEVIAKVLVWVITGVLGFIAYHVWMIKKLIEKHELVLFGDEARLFDGIVARTIASQRYDIASRKALITVVSILCKHGVIPMDDELKEAIENLKKYE